MRFLHFSQIYRYNIQSLAQSHIFYTSTECGYSFVCLMKKMVMLTTNWGIEYNSSVALYFFFFFWKKKFLTHSVIFQPSSVSIARNCTYLLPCIAFNLCCRLHKIFNWNDFFSLDMKQSKRKLFFFFWLLLKSNQLETILKIRKERTKWKPVPVQFL